MIPIESWGFGVKQPMGDQKKFWWPRFLATKITHVPWAREQAVGPIEQGGHTLAVDDHLPPGDALRHARLDHEC